MTYFPLSRITRIEPIHKEPTGRVLSSVSDLTDDDLECGTGIGLCLLCMLNPSNPDRESFERIIRHYCEMLAAKGYLGSGEEVWKDLFKQPTTQNKADWITTTWEVAGFVSGVISTDAVKSALDGLIGVVNALNTDLGQAAAIGLSFAGTVSIIGAAVKALQATTAGAEFLSALFNPWVLAAGAVVGAIALLKLLVRSLIPGFP